MTNVPSYKYMEKFQCTGPDCVDTCCRGWEIYVSKNEKKKIEKALNFIPDLKTTAKDVFQRNRKAHSEMEMYKININTENKLCGLYEPSGLCMIHKHLGEEYLPTVCATYPKSLALINNEYELSGSLSCPEVAKLCLLEEDAFTKSIKSINMSTTQTLTKLTPEIYTHALSRNILLLREMFVGFMGLPGIDYKSKLFLTVYFASKIADCDSDTELSNIINQFTSQNYLTEILQQFSLLPSPEKKFSLLFIKTILIAGRVTSSGNTVLFDLIKEILADFGGDDADISAINDFYTRRLDELGDSDKAKLDLALKNYARNFLTRSYFISYDSLLAYFYEMLMLVATLKFLIVCHPKFGSESIDDIIIDSGYRLARTYEHNVEYLSHIREAVKENQFLTLAHLANLIML